MDCLDFVYRYCALTGNGTILKCRAWHCAACAVIMLQAKKRNLPPLSCHAPLQVYPLLSENSEPQLNLIIFILSRFSDTQSNLGGMLRDPLTLQRTCHLFSRWSGQLLRHLEDQKQALLVCGVKEKEKPNLRMSKLKSRLFRDCDFKFIRAVGG